VLEGVWKLHKIATLRIVLNVATTSYVVKCYASIAPHQNLAKAMAKTLEA
jgi:hypothetical protein